MIWNEMLHILWCGAFITIPAIAILWYMIKHPYQEPVYKRPKSLYHKPERK